MDYNQLISSLEEEGISEETKAERLKELKEYVQSERHLYDDHGSYIIGSREV